MREGGSYRTDAPGGAAKRVAQGGGDHPHGNRARDPKGKPHGRPDALKQRSGRAENSALKQRSGRAKDKRSQVAQR